MTEIPVLTLLGDEFQDKSLTVPSVFWAVSAIAINFTTDICSFPVFCTVAKFIGCENFFGGVRFMTNVRSHLIAVSNL